MVMMLEETYLPVTLSAPGLTDEGFQEFCERYPEYRLEYTAEGDLIIMPFTDPETGVRNSQITRQLGNWAEAHGGFVTDSSAGFVLPNGARRSPDAAWLSPERYRQGQRTCPEFVIELRSSSDRLRQLKAKMEEWIENGAVLGWLIDPANRTVWIYRAGQAEPQELHDAARIEGEGPVAGFALDLSRIWP